LGKKFGEECFSSVKLTIFAFGGGEKWPSFQYHKSEKHPANIKMEVSWL
jgi:hypothetical protein